MELFSLSHQQDINVVQEVGTSMELALEGVKCAGDTIWKLSACTCVPD